MGDAGRGAGQRHCSLRPCPTFPAAVSPSHGRTCTALANSFETKTGAVPLLCGLLIPTLWPRAILVRRCDRLQQPELTDPASHPLHKAGSLSRTDRVLSARRSRNRESLNFRACHPTHDEMQQMARRVLSYSGKRKPTEACAWRVPSTLSLEGSGHQSQDGLNISKVSMLTNSPHVYSELFNRLDMRCCCPSLASCFACSQASIQRSA